MRKKLRLDYQGKGVYASEKGHTLQREKEYGNKWVFRNTSGNVRDMSEYQENVCFRNNLELR